MDARRARSSCRDSLLTPHGQQPASQQQHRIGAGALIPASALPCTGKYNPSDSMMLPSGSRLGPLEILSPLGAGGPASARVARQWTPAEGGRPSADRYEPDGPAPTINSSDTTKSVAREIHLRGMRKELYRRSSSKEWPKGSTSAEDNDSYQLSNQGIRDLIVASTSARARKRFSRAISPRDLAAAIAF